MTTRALLAASIVAAVGLLGAYVAAGGGTYRPLEPQDPCERRPLEDLEGSGRVLEQLALSALDGAACALRVTREDLTLAIATEESRARFAREHHIGPKDLEQAVRKGLERAARDAERSGRLSPLEAAVVREAVGRLPVGGLVDLLRSSRGRRLADLVEDLIRRGGP